MEWLLRLYSGNIDYVLVVDGPKTKVKAGSVEMSEVKNSDQSSRGNHGYSRFFQQPNYAKSMETKLKKILIIAATIFAASAVQAQTSQLLTIKNVRTYGSGLIVQVAENVNSSCSYPDHLQLFTTNQNYQASLSLFMTAWVSGKNIKAYYNGCGEDASSTGHNVNVTGWYIY